MTIDYKALAERIEQIIECNERTTLIDEEIDPLRAVVTMLREAAEAKPVAWIDEFGNAFPLDAWKPAKRTYLDAHKDGWNPLFAHPAPNEAAEAKPALWMQSDHVDIARKSPFMARCSPTQLQPDFVPLYLHPAPQPQPCTDPACPCQGGDPCHYVDHGKTKAMPQPQPERQPVSEPTEAQIEEYEILCNGEWVAGANGPGARAEILHYLTQYEQDGPCEVYAITRRLVDRAALAAGEK